MESTDATRGAITALHREGISISEIARRTRVSRPTVYRWIRRYEETGRLDDMQRSGRPRCTTNEEDLVMSQFHR